MLMKAVIVDREYKNAFTPSNKYKVRIPVLHGDGVVADSTKDDLLPSAVICGLPGSDYNYQKGDIVFIDFEENDYGKPVILGSLYLTTSKTNTRPDLKVSSLDASPTSNDGAFSANKVVLPENTTIGDISYKDLKSLVALRNNFGDLIKK